VKKRVGEGETHIGVSADRRVGVLTASAMTLLRVSLDGRRRDVWRDVSGALASGSTPRRRLIGVSASTATGRGLILHR
jgi:hypothetical protein